jgi:acid phosphatase
LAFLASQGILLTNYYATTHPSEPNYCAVVAGDNFGMDNDDFNALPSNISTVVDLLDTKGISWAEYQQDMPYAGFQGFNFSNQKTYANDYVRKHDPLILFDSVTNNATRRSLIKNFTSFYSDLAAQTLPQWSFITPNMTNDGHDTNVTFAGSWARSFLEPLLNNSYFMNNTLIVLTFDEDETYTIGNKVYNVLLGGAIPASLKGTTDSTFYNHYSMLSTVEVNWGLPSLGRWDCGANVLEVVANKTGYVNSVVNTTNIFFNSSYPGAVSDTEFYPVWPVPDTLSQCASGKGVLGSIISTWGNSSGTYNYTNVYPYDAAAGNNVGGSPVLAAFVTSSSSSSATGTATGTGTGTSTGSSTGTSASPTSSAGFVNVGIMAVLGMSAMVAAMLL